MSTLHYSRIVVVMRRRSHVTRCYYVSRAGLSPCNTADCHFHLYLSCTPDRTRIIRILSTTGRHCVHFTADQAAAAAAVDRRETVAKSRVPILMFLIVTALSLSLSSTCNSRSACGDGRRSTLPSGAPRNVYYYCTPTTAIQLLLHCLVAAAAAAGGGTAYAGPTVALCRRVGHRLLGWSEASVSR